MKGEQRRERAVSTGEWCNEATRMIIASGSDSGIAGWRTTRRTTAFEELDDDHAATTAGARGVPIGCGAVRIGCVVQRRRLRWRLWSGDQLSSGVAPTLGSQSSLHSDLQR
jgi:hypothetical protein